MVADPGAVGDDVPPALHAHAMDNLRFIRQTMERAGPFTAVPGWGGVAIGVVGLVAAAVADVPGGAAWMWTWLGAAAVAAGVGIVTMLRKARASNLPVTGTPFRRFALAYVPPIAAGAALTPVFAATESRRGCPAAGCCSTAPRWRRAARCRCASCRSWGWRSWSWASRRLRRPCPGATRSWPRGSAASTSGSV